MKGPECSIRYFFMGVYNMKHNTCWQYFKALENVFVMQEKQNFLKETRSQINFFLLSGKRRWKVKKINQLCLVKVTG